MTSSMPSAHDVMLGNLPGCTLFQCWSDVVCEVSLHLQHSFASKRAVLGFSEEVLVWIVRDLASSAGCVLGVLAAQQF